MPSPTRGTAPPPTPWSVKPTNAESTVNTAPSRSFVDPHTGPPSAAPPYPYPSNAPPSATLTNPYSANGPPSATLTNPYPVTGTWPDSYDPDAKSPDPWSATSANTGRSSNGATERGIYADNPTFAPQHQHQHQPWPTGRLTIQHDPRLAHIFEPMPPMTTTTNTSRGAGVDWRVIDWNPPRSSGTPAANTNANRRGSESVVSAFSQQFPHDFPSGGLHRNVPPPSPYTSSVQHHDQATDQAENPTRGRNARGRRQWEFVPESGEVEWRERREWKSEWECGWCGEECFCEHLP
jgi:hypothetical protein